MNKVYGVKFKLHFCSTYFHLNIFASKSFSSSIITRRGQGYQEKVINLCLENVIKFLAPKSLLYFSLPSLPREPGDVNMKFCTKFFHFKLFAPNILVICVSGEGTKIGYGYLRQKVLLQMFGSKIFVIFLLLPQGVSQFCYTYLLQKL